MTRDLSLLCYEEVPWFRWWHPPITVVDNGAVSIADLAVDLLLKSMADKHSLTQVAPREHRVDAQLIIRDSCAPPLSF